LRNVFNYLLFTAIDAIWPKSCTFFLKERKGGYIMKKCLILMVACSLFVAMLSASNATAGMVYAVYDPLNTDNNPSLYTWDTSTPGTQTLVGPTGLPSGSTHPNTWQDYVVGSEFDPKDGTLYVTTWLLNPANNKYRLGTINTSTGAYTQVTEITGIDGAGGGLAVDPLNSSIYYYSFNHAPSSPYYSNLYTLNKGTGVASFIGSTAAGNSWADIAFDSSGQLWAIDVGTDSLYKVDKATGAITLVGGIGFNLQAAQGLDFDFSTGILYGMLQGATSTGVGINTSFMSINTTSGLANLLTRVEIPVHNSILDGEAMDLAIWRPAPDSTTVPEPATMLLLGSGLLGLVGYGRKKFFKK
jgi:hypothetical protein